MLSKLIKHEYKATARIFLPFFGAILAMGVINRLFFASDIPESPADWAAILSVVIYLLLIFSTFLLTYAVMIGRFYKNMLGREGYLMHTLPVRPWQHIVSKCLVSLLWMGGALLSTVISVFIMVASGDFYRSFIDVMAHDILPFMDDLGGHGIAYMAEFLLLFPLTTLAGILMLYACIALGQLVPGHRILGAFIAYLVLSTALQFVSMAITLPIQFLDQEFFRDFSQEQLQWALHVLLGSSLLLGIAQCAVFFGITNHILSRQLNLE